MPAMNPILSDSQFGNSFRWKIANEQYWTTTNWKNGVIWLAQDIKKIGLCKAPPKNWNEKKKTKQDSHKSKTI